MEISSLHIQTLCHHHNNNNRIYSSCYHTFVWGWQCVCTWGFFGVQKSLLSRAIEFPLLKGMLYPPGKSELLCHKLPTIPREIFWKFGLNFVPLIILSYNRISTLKIDSMYNHAKFHKVRSNTWAIISILRITWP